MSAAVVCRQAHDSAFLSTVSGSLIDTGLEREYRVYQYDWSGFEVDYIHKCGEQNYKY